MADAYGRFLWSFRAKFSGPGKPISQKIIAIRAILNPLYTLMLKKIENKSKNFRHSSTLSTRIISYTINQEFLVIAANYKSMVLNSYS